MIETNKNSAMKSNGMAGITKKAETIIVQHIIKDNMCVGRCFQIYLNKDMAHPERPTARSKYFSLR